MIKKVFQKIKSIIYCRNNNNLEFYYIKNDREFEFDSNRCFYDIDNAEEFIKICSQYNIPVDVTKNYGFDKIHFCLLTDEKSYGCYGWYTTNLQKVSVLEIDKHSFVPENCSILIDFYTNPERRRQGFYCELLKRMISANKKEYSLIYALDSNTPSVGAIRKVGFIYLGKYNYHNFIGFDSMIKNIDKN